MSGKDSIASNYKGEAGRIYSQGRGQETLNHLGYQIQKRHFLPFLGPKMNVLDFGCGSGSLARAIKPHVASIEGLEVNPFPREIAISQQGLTVHESLEAIADKKRYDAIISNHVLEHIPNVGATLMQLRDLLISQGVFITVLPIEDFRTAANRDWQSDEPNHHLHTWTPLLIANTLREAGMKPIASEIITEAWTPKLFFLGDNVLQKLACYLVSVLKKRRQLLVAARIE